METLVELLIDSAATYRDRPALVTSAGLRADVWSYQRLSAAANHLAHQLREVHGFLPEDRILVRAANSPQLVAVYLAAMQARLVLVPLDPHSSPDFMQRIGRETSAVALLFSGSVPAIPELRSIDVASLSFDGSSPPLADLPSPADVVEIVFTSGPMGRPRGVVLTHGNILSNAMATSNIVDRDRHWRLLSVLPLSHMLEQTVGLFVPLHLGSTIYYVADLKPPHIRKAMQRYRITSMVVVPKLLALLMQGTEREVRNRGQWSRWQWVNRLSGHLPMRMRRMLFGHVHRELGGALEFFISGGAYLDTELWSKWERIGVRVVQGYGATECSPVIASNTLHERTPGSVGRALAGVEVRLSEDEEIQVRGKNVSGAYWHDEEASLNASTTDGWYRTGDLATLDGQGNLFLHGRLSDTIVLPNGLNVFPQDLEAVLEAQEGVKGCVVLGSDDSSGDVRIAAAVVLAGRSKDPAILQESADAAVRATNAQLAAHQRISEVHVWEDADFPRTLIGTVQRREVAARLAHKTATRPQLEALADNPEELVDRLKQVIRSVTGVSESELHLDTELNPDLGFTSLAQVELAVSLEKTFGVTIDDSQLAEARSVRQLLALIESGGPASPSLPYSRWSLHRAVSPVRSLLQRVLVFNLHRLIARPFKVAGAANLATIELPALFIANHSSHMDTLSIIRALPTRIRKKTAVAAAADYFFASKLFGFLTMLLLNTFPFSRGPEVRSSLEYCGDLAQTGWSILIYPEGTRSTTRQLLPFKSGIGLLADQLGVPIVPVAVYGGFEILPKGRKFPRPAPVRVVFGEPIRLAGNLETAQVVSLLQDSLAALIETGRVDD